MLEHAGASTPNETSSVCPEAVVTVFVMEEMGLHARPAARLAQAAGTFHSDIQLDCEGRMANAKSILDILSLAVEHGTLLTITCRGDDAADAAQTLSHLFDETLVPPDAAPPFEVRIVPAGSGEA